MRRHWLMVRLAANIAAALLLSSAGARPQELEKIPFRQQPIDYFAEATDDVAARLNQRLERQEARLEFSQPQGYLPSLLAALDVPVESQLLVFAKNSVNARLISPANPRAIFFNEEVYVGYVPGAPALEIAAVDPRQGAMFYTLRQEAVGAPRLAREESCLLCHASVNSLHVPGHLARSFVTDAQGNPTRGRSQVDHSTPFGQRWGGWYVTGDAGPLAHQGNLSTAAALADYERNPAAPGRSANLPLELDAGRYPARSSDIVALLVHDHQVHGHNLITRVGYEERIREASGAPADDGAPTPMEERLVHYLLFADEAPLEGPVLGDTAFESGLARRAADSPSERFLRRLHLETRLFQARCSYLVLSRAFAALPARARGRVLRRMHALLAAETPAPPFGRLGQTERRAILETLREVRPAWNELRAGAAPAR